MPALPLTPPFGSRNRGVVSLVAGLLLIVGLSARASSVLHPLTPQHLRDEGFLFEITSKIGSGSVVEFRVVVSGKPEAFVSPDTSVSTVTNTADSLSIAGAGIPVHDAKTSTSITCAFMVPEKSLENPDLCFVFANYVQVLINGKMEPMPAVDFYYARLKDFVKKQPGH